MKLAVVTIHYKNLSDTLALIDSLEKATVPKGHSLKLYLVPNSHEVDLGQEIKSNLDYKIISNDQNLGFAAGNNLGVHTALEDGADVIIFLNNDTIVAPDFFKTIVSSPLDDPSVGAVGGLIYFAKGYEFKKNYSKEDLGQVIWYKGGEFDFQNILGRHLHVDQVDRDQDQSVFDTDFVTGCLLIIKANLLKDIGGFDENYFMYLEDVDLCFRLKKKGLRLVVDPKIKIWHKVAQSSGIGSALNDYFISRNRLYFASKFSSFRTRFALFRESFLRLFFGSMAQKTAFLDFLLGRFGRGSFKP